MGRRTTTRQLRGLVHRKPPSPPRARRRPIVRRSPRVGERRRCHQAWHSRGCNFPTTNLPAEFSSTVGPVRFLLGSPLNSIYSFNLATSPTPRRQYFAKRPRRWRLLQQVDRTPNRRGTQVHIPLRRADVLMAGEFLDRARTGPTHRQVRTERVIPTRRELRGGD